MSTKGALKHARSLQQKKFRDLHGQFLVQGPKVVQELLASGWPVEEVFATAEQADRMALRGATIVPAHELERVGTMESGNEVIAIARRPGSEAPVADVGTDELVLALDGISDPGNLGTLIRIADWFGVKRLWCAQGSVDAYNPKTVQAAMGALFRIPVAVVDLPALLARQLEMGVPVYLATMEGRSVFEVDLARSGVLVLGSESHGLSPEVRALKAALISIPGGGGSESLNVATAAAALCMEFTRQRLA
ncbi:MAG: RNA methyltransferase [Flavobacteriales bacterium]|nr:RNA methyltransferase [Flavobacteriales bacterium]